MKLSQVGWVLGGAGGSERVMGEWLVGQWIGGVISFRESGSNEYQLLESNSFFCTTRTLLGFF